MNRLVEALLRDPRRRAAARSLAQRFPWTKRLALRALSAASLSRLGPLRPGALPFVAGRRTILLCIHEASRTGAPILGWNLAGELSARHNVVCLLLGEGELVGDLESRCCAIVGPRAGSIKNCDPRALARRVLKPVRARFGLDGVIANSSESEVAASAAHGLGIPAVTLFHEFAEYVAPARLRRVVENSSAILFSSRLLADAARRVSGLPIPDARVVPQGRCAVPRGGAERSAALDALLKRCAEEGAFLCIGCGFVQPRKGVDLFIATGAQVLRRGVNARFAWVGAGFDPANDFQLSVWLKDQIRRSGCESRIDMVPELGSADLQRLYGAAGAMFLSSRLDPLPNVAIDALTDGVPVVCFEGASGLAEMLAGDEVLAGHVVPYFDIGAAADALATLAEDRSRRQEASERARALAARLFSMKRYVEAVLSGLGLGHPDGREDAWRAS